MLCVQLTRLDSHLRNRLAQGAFADDGSVCVFGIHDVEVARTCREVSSGRFSIECKVIFRVEGSFRFCLKGFECRPTYCFFATEGEVNVDVFAVNFELLICRVGEGRLRHDVNGFRLTGCGGKLDFTQKPETSYSLYADYFWYELGDMICIGDRDVLYYCFPQGKGDVVAKTRLAAEELYKLKRAERAAKNG